MERIEEELTGRAHTIGHGGLEVWVGIHSEEVELGDEVIVGSIDVNCPCVDVANGLTGKRSTSNGIACLLNIVDQLFRLSARTRQILDAGRGDAV